MKRLIKPMHGPIGGHQRVVITGVEPAVDGGRFPIKRVVGEQVAVSADAFADGHDLVTCALRYRRQQDAAWSLVPMEHLGSDRWQGVFRVTEAGRYFYTLQAWIDRFRTWSRDLARRAEAGQDPSVDLRIGAKLVMTAARLAADGQAGTVAPAPDVARWLEAAARTLAGARKGAGGASLAERLRLALGDELAGLMGQYGDRRPSLTYPVELAVVVDRERARFGTWYELFPRSCSPEPGRHGTFRDCAARLPELAAMGFDVLYLPPIHPIGRTNRKGRNNSAGAAADDPGSPWAIGGEAGGHTAVHPQLGTLEDFRTLLAKARDCGIEIALDLAFQCSPDHPYVTAHPRWFRRRPDGSVQYAENPPKRYQDIFPFDFETQDWRALWAELLRVVLFWVDQGVRIFRVDNPHTKPLPFWEWLFTEIKQAHPDVIFLAEAFTRPRLMYHLAKVGFTQSYTYFAWRNTRQELTEYFTELTQTGVREYFRPNLWPNTPDILTEYLQWGGRPAFMARLVLAATLAASYGIYGPAFELCEARAAAPGSEEYLDSEKYQLRYWGRDRPDSLREFIQRVNCIRRTNPALQADWNLNFHPTDNDRLIAYTKHTDDLANAVLTVVNLDPRSRQSGWVDLPLAGLGLDPQEPYQVHDLLTDARYLWQGPRNYVELNPYEVPAHIFRIRRRVRSERNFDYFT